MTLKNKFGTKFGNKLMTKLITKLENKLGTKFGDKFGTKLGTKFGGKFGDELGIKLGERMMNQETKERLAYYIPQIAREAAPVFKKNGWKYWYSRGEYASEKDIRRMLDILNGSNWNYWMEPHKPGDPIRYWHCGGFVLFIDGRVILGDHHNVIKEWTLPDA